jgi:hypothetical protein
LTQAQRIRQGAHEDHSLVLQRLAARHQGVTAELGQLIETGEARPGGEADSAGGRAPGDAVVGGADLPRAEMLPVPKRPSSEMEWWDEQKGRR